MGGGGPSGGGDGPGGGGGGKKCAECGKPIERDVNGDGIIDENDERQEGLVGVPGSVDPRLQDAVVGPDGRPFDAGVAGTSSGLPSVGDAASAAAGAAGAAAAGAATAPGVAGAAAAGAAAAGAVVNDPASGETHDGGNSVTSESGRETVPTLVYKRVSKEGVEPFKKDKTIGDDTVLLKTGDKMGMLENSDQLIRKLKSVTVKIGDKTFEVPADAKFEIGADVFKTWKLPLKNEALLEELKRQKADLKDAKEAEVTEIKAEELDFTSALVQKPIEDKKS